MKHSILAPQQYLAHTTLPWLLTAAFVTALPHVQHLPAWISALVALMQIHVVWQWRTGYRITSAWARVGLVLLCCAGVALQFGLPPTGESGIAMLALLISMKLLELKSRRDSVVLLTLCYFLLLTQYFYSQNILTGVWLIVCTLIVTAALLKIHTDPQYSVALILRRATRLLLQALPFTLALYLLFPRVNGPLWGMEQGVYSMTGLSNSMAPGSISELFNSDEIAFRVQFEGEPPPRRQLYWRGPVFTHYNGRIWEGEDFLMQPPKIGGVGKPYAYSLTLEAHQHNWLLPLEMPTHVEGVEANMTRNGLLRSRRPVNTRTRLELVSYPEYRMDAEASLPYMLQRSSLQLPRDYNPRALALAQSWRAEDPDPRRLMERALRYFHDEAFYYTLEPPLLGTHAMDDFIFNTRRGFCEHYASAFVTLMRAAEVPARVVTGYLGGEQNPVDGVFVVRQSSAHAWAEIWIAQQGWIRVDPTTAIPRKRVSANVAANLVDIPPELAGRAASWLQNLHYRWDAMNNSWNQWVLGYTPDRQRALLSNLGLVNPSWQRIVTVLAIVMATLFLLLTLWLLQTRPDPSDPAWKLWRRALRHLEKQGVRTHLWETPLALGKRLQTERPELAAHVLALARLVCAARYETSAGDESKMTNIRTLLRLLLSKRQP
jgi:transglutaminase-like putative cysteine protease